MPIRAGSFWARFSEAHIAALKNLELIHIHYFQAKSKTFEYPLDFRVS